MKQTKKNMYNCNFCNTEFSTQSKLQRHKDVAQYCINIRQQNNIIWCNFCHEEFTTENALQKHKEYSRTCIDLRTEKNIIWCEYCFSEFSSETTLQKHKESAQYCLEQRKETETETESKLEEEDIVENLIRRLNEAEEKCEIYKNVASEYLDYIINNPKSDFEPETNYKELLQKKELEIQYLKQKYVKKHQRPKYIEPYVIYILTTQNMKKERRYILGKTTNLTNRLSVYNKSDEHEVVYHQSCYTKENMDKIEPKVFELLSKHREQANRERFILPENYSITLFVDVIRTCIKDTVQN